MSQPSNRGAKVPLPGSLDSTLKEFWVENPWRIASEGHNLSCYERNRVFLNSKGKDFLEISHLTGADSDGDGRSVIAADFRNSGMMDLVVRQCGGGALLYFENKMEPKGWLRVSLKGKKSNKQGIGAKVIAKVNGLTLVRELYPANTYCSQSPCEAHFGLGDAQKVDSLEVRWPSGIVQTMGPLTPNQKLGITEPAGDETK